MAATLWLAPKATVNIATATEGTRIGSTTAVNTYITALSDEAAYELIVKDVKVSGGERDIEALKLLGYNELREDKRAGVVEASFTVAYQGSIKFMNSALTRSTNLDPFEMVAGIKQTVTGNYKRSTLGEKATNDRTTKAVNIRLTSGSTTVDLLLDQAICTSIDFNLAADGSAESTLTFKCLASDYYEEDNYA